MKKSTELSAIVAKCWDGAFRKITMIPDHGNGINAVVRPGKNEILGTYDYNDGKPVFLKA